MNIKRLWNITRMEPFDFPNILEVRIAIKVSWRLHSLSKAQLRLPERTSKKVPILYHYLLAKFDSTPTSMTKLTRWKVWNWMYETGPQVLSPVRKPNQIDAVTWNVTRDLYPFTFSRFPTKNYIPSKNIPNPCFFDPKET